MMMHSLGKQGRSHKREQKLRNRSRQNHGQVRLGFEPLEQRALLAVTTAIQTGAWDSVSTWSDGVPDSTSRAVIPTAVTVTLTGTDHVAEEIVVQGILDVAESAGTTKTLTADWIHVNSGGVFQIGTQQDRYDANDFVITLTGDNPNESFTVEGAGTISNNNGFLMVAGGGRLQFFGEEKLTYTRLAETADIGVSQIRVEAAVDRDYDGDIDSTDGALNWEVGDQIVIASSSRDYRDEEVRLITAISDQGDGTFLITLDAALQERHYGEIETYSNVPSLPGDFNSDGVVSAPDYTVWRDNLGDIDEGALNGAGDGTGGVDLGDYAIWREHFGDTAEAGQEGRSWEVDLRAEVAILNRNVRIQGEASHDTDNQFGDRARFEAGTGDGFGGHTMIMASAGQITIDSVQFDRMGQTGRLGRYPIHWHVAGDRAGDILRGASITNSNNRGVTVHGTHNLLIQDVVLHDVHGHGFFMEDAVETGNEYRSNIAFGIHKVGRSEEVGDFAPDVNDPFIVDTHDHVGQNANRFLSSAAYWITNPDNTWVGNISAGSEGTGFWFILPDRAIGVAAGDSQYNGVNASRTNLLQFDYNSSHSSPAGLNFDRGSDIEVPVGAQLKAFFDGDQYLPPQEPQINSYTGYKHRVGLYHRGQEANFHENRYVDNFTSTFVTFTQRITDTLYVGNSRGNADLSDPVTGHTIYDGASTLDGNHFAGFAASNAHTFRVHSAANRFTSHQFSNTSFEADGSAGHVSIATQGGGANHSRAVGGAAAAALYDVDGTLTGHVGGGPGSTVVTNHPFFYDSTDVLPAGWNAVVTDDLYAQLQFKPVNSNAAIRVTAPDGDFGTESNSSFNTHVKTNDGDYVVSFPDGVGSIAAGFTLKHFLRVGPNNGTTVIRFEDVGGQLAPQGVSPVSGLTALRNATGTSYAVIGNDLWVKFFSSGSGVVFNPVSQPSNPLTIWQDNDPLGSESVLGSSLSVNTVSGAAATGDSSRALVGEVILEGTNRYGNINGGTIDVAPEYRGTGFLLSIDYFVPIGTTLDSLPDGSSEDVFYVQLNVNGVNTASAGFISGDDAAGDGWQTVTLSGTLPGNTSNVLPFFIVADGGFGGAAPNGNGSGTAVYIDNIELTIGLVPGSGAGAGSATVTGMGAAELSFAQLDATIPPSRKSQANVASANELNSGTTAHNRLLLAGVALASDLSQRDSLIRDEAWAALADEAAAGNDATESLDHELSDSLMGAVFG